MKKLCYIAEQEKFGEIPGNPFAYWLHEHWFDVFENNSVLRDKETMKKGMSTGDNARFIKEWYEVSLCSTMYNANNIDDAKLSGKKWFPITAGGEGRKWYGNRNQVVNWQNDGQEMKSNAIILNHGGHWSRYIVSPDLFFKPHIAWSAISSSSITVRYMGYGFAFNSAAMVVFTTKPNYYLALINSVVAKDILTVLAPTLNYGVEQIGKIPVIISREEDVNEIVDDCIATSVRDWDSFETSWDFKKHPLI